MVVTITVPEIRTFEFTIPGVPGVHTLPMQEGLSKKLARKYAAVQDAADQNTAALDWLDELFRTYCPELNLDDMPMSVTQAIMQAWTDASQGDVTMGESASSSASATSTPAASTTISSSVQDAPSAISPTV